MRQRRSEISIYVLAAVSVLVIAAASALGLGAARFVQGAGGSIGYAVHQYDGGITHTYTINADIKPMNISVGGAIYGTPTIYNGVMYATTMGRLKDLQDSRYDLTKGQVVAIDMQTGKIVWNDMFPNQIMTQPIIAGGLVIVGMSNNGEVPSQYYNLAQAMIGINATTGKVVWEYPNHARSPTGPDLVTPAYYKGLIIEPGMGTVEIYNASTGALVRSVNTGLPDILSSPLLVNGTAYFGAGYGTAYGYNSFSYNISGVRMNITSDERLFALDPATGHILWDTRFVNAGEGLNDVSPAWANGIVVAAYLYQSDYTDPWMMAVNSTNGQILWQLNETKYIKEHGLVTPYAIDGVFLNYTQNTISPITIVNGTAYLNSNYIGFLMAVNISRGEIMWATPTGQNEGNPNVFLGHYLLTVSDGGLLFVINSTNGDIVNVTNIGMPHLASQPIITDNYAILSGMDGRIVTLPLQALIKPNRSLLGSGGV